MDPQSKRVGLFVVYSSTRTNLLKIYISKFVRYTIIAQFDSIILSQWFIEMADSKISLFWTRYMINRPLSNLEQEVMRIVWDLKQCSIRDVMEKLSQRKKLAYTTVATILTRLQAKGLVERDAKETAYIYKPALSRRSYSRYLIQSFLDRLIDSFGDTAIASFAESIDRLPKEKKEYFLKLLEKANE